MEKAQHFLLRCLASSAATASYLPKVYFMLAASSQLLNRQEDSARYCHEGITRFPQCLELWFQEGTLHLTTQDWSNAQRCFEAILNLPEQSNYFGLDPELRTSRTRHNLAFALRQQHQFQSAEKQWQQTIANCPSFAPPWLSLLELYLEQKRLNEAEGLIDRLPGNPSRRVIEPAILARLALAKGDVFGARRLLENAVTRMPHAVWLRSVLAELLVAHAKDDKAAEVQLRRIQSEAPNDLQCRQRLAQIMAG